VAAAALLAALSPVLVYYSRFYIQESAFVFFTTGFLVSLGRYVERPGVRWGLLSGAFAGLAYSTKETSVIVIGSAVAACFVAAGAGRIRELLRERRPLVLGVLAGLVVAFLFFSSFLVNPFGIAESILAFTTYVERGVDPARHVHPWNYYLGLLAWSRSGGLLWSEALVLFLSAAGALYALAGPQDSFWARYVLVFSVLCAAIFSALPYKTPWNLLPFYAGFILLAGHGADGLLRVARYPAARAALMVVMLIAGVQLGLQSWRASFRYPADSRNPYAYAQTVPDFLRLVERVRDLAALHPDGSAMLVKVFAGPYEQWPLPWYLRDMTRVGYWTGTDGAGTDGAGTPADAPVVVASQENSAALEAALGDRYVPEFYGLRQDVLLTLYIERSLWESFLAGRSRPPTM
jgi:uncharacterized protein (TIGR03663 family)